MTLEYALKCLNFNPSDFIPTANEYNQAIEIACAAIQEKIDRGQESKNSVKEVCENCRWYEKDDECWNGVCELMPGPVFEPDDSCNKFKTKEE